MMINRFLGCRACGLKHTTGMVGGERSWGRQALPVSLAHGTPHGTHCETSVAWTRCEVFEQGVEGERECIHLRDTRHLFIYSFSDHYRLVGLGLGRHRYRVKLSHCHPQQASFQLGRQPSPGRPRREPGPYSEGTRVSLKGFVLGKNAIRCAHRRAPSCSWESAWEPHLRMIPWLSIPLTSWPCTLAPFPGVDCTAASSQAGALEAGGCEAWAAHPAAGPARSPAASRRKAGAGLMPASSWQVLALARQQNRRVKVVGGGHSPSDIACTDGFMIHMGKMNRLLQVLRALGSPLLLAPAWQPRPPPQAPGNTLAFALRHDPLPAPESKVTPQFLTTRP